MKIQKIVIACILHTCMLHACLHAANALQPNKKPHEQRKLALRYIHGFFLGAGVGSSIAGLYRAGRTPHDSPLSPYRNGYPNYFCIPKSATRAFLIGLPKGGVAGIVCVVVYEALQEK